MALFIVGRVALAALNLPRSLDADLSKIGQERTSPAQSTSVPACLSQPERRQSSMDDLRACHPSVQRQRLP